MNYFNSNIGTCKLCAAYLPLKEDRCNQCISKIAAHDQEMAFFARITELERRISVNTTLLCVTHLPDLRTTYLEEIDHLSMRVVALNDELDEIVHDTLS